MKTFTAYRRNDISGTHEALLKGTDKALEKQTEFLLELQGKSLNEHRCPWRQDLRLYCFEERCDKSGCPVWAKETGYLAEALSMSR